LILLVPLSFLPIPPHLSEQMPPPNQNLLLHSNAFTPTQAPTESSKNFDIFILWAVVIMLSNF
jgi:hypothetical protein